jgi:hypothetical protein
MKQDIQKYIDALTTDDWQEIHSIYNEIVSHKGPFYETKGGEVEEDGVISMPYYDSAPIVIKTMQFLYDKKLIVDFDWGTWDKGREIFRRSGENKYADVSLIDCFKLLTAVARNSRFNEGVFDLFFESGDARLLIKQILKFNPYKVSK